MKSQGFTLIELVVVIVILGIMSAVAIPKFVDLQTDARISAMAGVEGAIRGAATLVYSKSLIEGEEDTDEGNGASSQVVVQGLNIDTKFGYPNGSATGIEIMLDLEGDITTGNDGTVVTFTYGSFSSCTITYTEAASAGAAPAIVNNANAANC